MNIYFLRHASAGQRKSIRKQDEKRPLDSEGIEQSKLMGRLLAKLEVEVDAIVSSPLTRAIETATLAAQEIRNAPNLQVDDALRPDALFSHFQALLQRYSRKDTIMVVGHNQNLSEFVSELISDEASNRVIDLRKGALAKVDYDNGRATLHWCVTPKLVREVQATVATKSRPKSSRK